MDASRWLSWSDGFMAVFTNEKAVRSVRDFRKNEAAIWRKTSINNTNKDFTKFRLYFQMIAIIFIILKNAVLFLIEKVQLINYK